jgi:hypothetical protein
VNSAFETLRDAVDLDATPAGLAEWFAHLDRALRAGDLTTTQAELLASTGYRAVRASAESSEGDRRALVLDFLLPRALQASEYNGFVRPTEGDFVRRRLREIVDASSPDSRDELLRAISERVVESLSLGDPTAACLVAATIGVRTTELVDQLLGVSGSRDEAVADLALFTLAVLQPSGGTRELVFELLLQRAEQRFTVPRGRGLAIFGDRKALDVAIKWHSQSEPDDTTMQRFLAVALIGRIAKTNFDDLKLHDRIWRTLRQTTPPRSTPSLGVFRFPEFRESINSPEIVRQLSRDLVAVSRQAAGQNQVTRLAEEATRCLLPRQLAGWEDTDLAALAEAIRPFACRDTQYQGRMKTAEFRDKEVFWGLALHAGLPDLLSWFDDGIAKETNPHLRLSLSREFACFKLDRMPKEATPWLVRRYDLQPNDDRSGWTDAFAGAAIARSAGTKDAFEALLLTGFSIRENASADVVDALIDVTLRLANTEPAYVAERLAEVVGAGESWQRDAAAAALAEFTAVGHADYLTNRRVKDLALGESRISRFAQGILIASLGSMSADILDSSDWEVIRRFAQQRDKDVAPRALVVLAQHDRLADDTELLENVLGLSRTADGWRFKPHPEDDPNRSVYFPDPGAWGPHILGYLFRRSPEEFGPAVAQALQSSDINVRVQAIAALGARSAAGPALELPAVVRDALMECTLSGQTSFSSTLDAFDHLGELAPDLLLHTRWADHSRSWLPAARARLARSIGTAATRSVESTIPAEALDTLATLATDQDSTVRREAMHSLASASPRTLEGLARAWAGHLSSAWRQRGAEMLEFLNGDVTNASSPFGDLLRDSDPLVRERSEASVEAKRKSDWTRMYIGALRESVSGQDHDLLTLRRYLNAIVALGDERAAVGLRALQRGAKEWRVRAWLKIGLDQLESRIGATRKDEGTGLSALDRDVVVKRTHGFVIAGANATPATITLWASPQARPGEQNYWGGTALSAHAHFLPTNEDRLKVQLDTGEPLNILIKDARHRLFREGKPDETYLVFTGNGEIPEFMQR